MNNSVDTMIVVRYHPTSVRGIADLRSEILQPKALSPADREHSRTLEDFPVSFHFPHLSPNDLFGIAEAYAMRGAMSLIFLIGLYKVVKDTIQKILK